MTPMTLRNGKTAAAALSLALAMLLVLIGLNPTLSAFTATVANSSNTAGTAPYFTCAAAATADKTALFAYPLNETSASTRVIDISSNGMNGAYQGSMASQQTSPIACPRDPGGTYVLNGSSSYISTPRAYNNPTVFSEEVWFKTSTAGGQLIGFGNNPNGLSDYHDRKIYLNTNGQLVFGIYNSTTQVLVSPQAYTDGIWHQVVATLSPSTGMRLFVDGSLVASNTSYKTASDYTGYWRIGYDKLVSWPGNPSNYYFTGSMRYAAVYTTVLTPAQISNHYTAGR